MHLVIVALTYLVATHLVIVTPTFLVAVTNAGYIHEAINQNRGSGKR